MLRPSVLPRRAGFSRHVWNLMRSMPAEAGTPTALPLLLVFLLAGLGLGQATQPIDPPESTVPFAQAAALAAVGDPKAIRPAMELLEAQAKAADPSIQDRAIRDAARIVGQFGYTPAAAVLQQLLANNNVGPSVRDEVLIALTRLNGTSLAPLLKEQLSSNRSLLARSHAARALLQMGDPAGQPFLLAELQGYLDELEAPRQFRSGVRDVLSRMNDAGLIDAVEAMAAKQKTELAKANALALTQTMRMAARPVAELTSIAQDTSWAKATDRYDALEALADRGTPAEIPVLLALKPWDGIDTAVATLQREQLRQDAAAAVNRIQQRCWQPLAQAGTPLVSDALRRLEKLHGDPPSKPIPIARPRRYPGLPID